jgi:hypothetical protein
MKCRAIWSGVRIRLRLTRRWSAAISAARKRWYEIQRSEPRQCLLWRTQLAAKPSIGVAGFERIGPGAFFATGSARALLIWRQRKPQRRAALRTFARLMDLSHSTILNRGRRQVHSKCRITDGKFYSGHGPRRSRSTLLAARSSSRCSLHAIDVRRAIRICQPGQMAGTSPAVRPIVFAPSIAQFRTYLNG